MRQVRKLPHVDGELGWLETSPDPAAQLGPRLKGQYEFDIAIIGAGFTGLSTALRLAEINPSARIALIEALRVGQGTSGRNAGFLIDLPHNVKFGETGAEHARALYRLNMFGIERLREFKDQHSIPSWHQAGKYMAAHEQSNMSGLDKFEGMLKHAGFEYDIVTGSALAKRLGTDYYRSAVFTPGNILVNPATLIRGLAKALPPSVSLFENSPVTAIEYGRPHKLRFLGGQITARTVVQAVNNFGEQFGKLSHRIVPIFTYGSLTQPIPDDLFARHFADVSPYGLTSAHLAGTTVRLTEDRRLFVRNIYDYHDDLRSNGKALRKAWKQHRTSFEARFPFLKQLVFDYTWGGMICMTQNYEPVFEDEGDGVYVIAGCNGVGIVKGTYLGYYMAEHIAGRDSENLRFIRENSRASWIPTGIFREVGANARIAWEALSAKGDV